VRPGLSSLSGSGKYRYGYYEPISLEIGTRCRDFSSADIVDCDPTMRRFVQLIWAAQNGHHAPYVLEFLARGGSLGLINVDKNEQERPFCILPLLRDIPGGYNIPRACINGTNIHYEVSGPGFAVVLCHGFGRSHQDWLY
jgi:hypothetical protein